ncbi:hypothetical protein [Streptomyces oceani]|uniref:Uncharacterized protein n=1 Tax=Streptomyces oceani TaxID=1075402 RepID=A0A1E7KFN0_9ACTN|nr:hypothetical protein [Streptomyces oceani]OEV02730.1 hypothetical protein AN216_14780 [Streptomyces oceani]
MAGREEPDEGTPGGDDEYRSVVFDESFVEAARLQEYSAKERLDDEEHAAVRSRPTPPGRRPFRASKQAIVLMLLIVLAFGTAVFMGIRNPFPGIESTPSGPMRSTTLPLQPRGEVPGSTPADLFKHSPAAQFRAGAEGITLPTVHQTGGFARSEVLNALTIVKDYLVSSSMDPSVLTGGAVRPVRNLVDAEQRGQFDQSVEHPRADGKHASTGWMVRFDPAKVALAAKQVRVNGTLAVEESRSGVLEITADHVFVYAVRPAGSGDGEAAAERASLFTVHRDMRFELDREDLREHQVRVAQATTRAGPMACSADAAETLNPLLAGQRAPDGGPAGENPYDRGRATCGVLADSAQPSPADE